MARIAIGYGDRVRLAAAITASSALATLPATNLATAQPGQVWRTAPATTSAHVLVDLGASRAIGAVLLVNTNLTATATWRIRLSTVDATGDAGDALDSGTVAAGIDPIYRKAVWLPASPGTGRYLKVNLSDAAVSEIEAGRLAALTLWRPVRNYRFGARRPFRDFSKTFTADQGQVWTLRGPLQRGLDFTLPAVTDAETDGTVEELIRESGRWNDVLVVKDPDSANLGRDSYWGPLEDLPAPEKIAHGWHSLAFRVMDRL